VIFDFDLTLADSSTAVAACITHALEHLGFPAASPDAVGKTIGLSLQATLETLTGNRDPSIQMRFRDLFVQHADVVMVAQTELLEGVPAALSALRDHGLRLAIVSTKYRYRNEAILDRHKAGDLFEVIVGGEDTSAHKPDPEGLERALRELKISAARCVYVGDHLVDAQAAMRAAVPFVAVLTGATERDDFLRFPSLGVLSSVAELPSFLSEVETWLP
jgi:phosphoglycolate phosphatase